MGRTIISEDGRFEWDGDKDRLNKKNHGFLEEYNDYLIDADVLAWFKSQGKGYQTRINKALRDVMTRSM